MLCSNGFLFSRKKKTQLLPIAVFPKLFRLAVFLQFHSSPLENPIHSIFFHEDFAGPWEPELTVWEPLAKEKPARNYLYGSPRHTLQLCGVCWYAPESRTHSQIINNMPSTCGILLLWALPYCPLMISLQLSNNLNHITAYSAQQVCSCQ